MLLNKNIIIKVVILLFVSIVTLSTLQSCSNETEKPVLKKSQVKEKATQKGAEHSKDESNHDDHTGHNHH